MDFLRYIIGPEGVLMDQDKVITVMKWPVPTTIKELQLFWAFPTFINDSSEVLASNICSGTLKQIKISHERKKEKSSAAIGV